MVNSYRFVTQPVCYLRHQRNYCKFYWVLVVEIKIHNGLLASLLKLMDSIFSFLKVAS